MAAIPVHGRGEPPFADFPMIREIGRMQAPRRTRRLTEHKNAGIEVCSIRSGRYDWQVEGRSYRLAPGDGFVTLPWQAHGGIEGTLQRGALDFVVVALERCGPRSAWRFGDWCPLDGDARRFVCRTLLGNLSALVPRAVGLGDGFDRLWLELREREPGHRCQVHALLGEILLRVARLVARPTATADDDPVVRGALRQIASRVSEPWTLATMAATAGLCRSRFSERVQRLSGLSPKRWLEAQRLERARQLLRHSDADITRVGIELGFSSSQYFATAFKRDCGVSPSAWRARRG